jgi:hypothetical protein
MPGALESTCASLRASEYEKLRLSPATVASALTARGLSLERYESDGGRVTIAAWRRPISE